jgi:hypothetical protein
MITKTFFLAKKIHRILTRNLRDKKSLHENLAGYRVAGRPHPEGAEEGKRGAAGPLRRAAGQPVQLRQLAPYEEQPASLCSWGRSRMA